MGNKGHKGNKHHHHHHGGGDWRKEDRIEGKINFRVGDPRFIAMAKWPVVLLDTTGSMNESCSHGGRVSRKDFVRDCMGEIIKILAKIDTVDTQAFGLGCPLVTFNAIEGGIFRGLIHADNIANEWPLIQFHGATHIMDGWKTMLNTYENAFTEQPQSAWPILLVLIITDGEIQDQEEFENHLKHVHGRAFVEIAVIGHGEDHDRALRHYQHISKHHHHVRATPFTGESDPRTIANQLVSLVAGA